MGAKKEANFQFFRSLEDIEAICAQRRCFRLRRAEAKVFANPIRAQDAGEISQCLTACAKSDKPCQDCCVPASAIIVTGRACLETCRFTARAPDQMVNLKACIGACLDQNAVSQ